MSGINVKPHYDEIRRNPTPVKFIFTADNPKGIALNWATNSQSELREFILRAIIKFGATNLRVNNVLVPREIIDSILKGN